MNFFERRRWKRTIKQILHEAAHVYHMRKDLLSAEQMAELLAAREEICKTWSEGDPKRIESVVERMGKLLEKLRPYRAFPWIRENVEVFVVAFAVAMAFRAYFIQPFKIPTASMQPTLYGITVEEQAGRRISDRFPLNIVKLVLWGERYIEVRAGASGVVRVLEDRENDRYVVNVGGRSHLVRPGMKIHVETGDHVSRKQLLASGSVRIGDHIFVDKVRYNFSRPKRGDIIVFSTGGIEFPDIKPNTFYIKRLAAIPGDRVALDPPHLLVNGQRLTEPFQFRRIVEDVEHGYHGYAPVNPHYGPVSWLWRPGVEKQLGAGEYLPLGDNSRHSLDGRYFGPVKANLLVGPAFMVYWPFSKRFGLVR